MATKSVTIDPDGLHDYTTLLAARNAMYAAYPNITADNGTGGPGIMQFVISGTWSSAESLGSGVTVDFSAFTTSVADYIEVYATGVAATPGYYSTGAYRLESADYGGNNIRACRYFRIHNMQIKKISASETAKYALYGFYGNVAGDIRIYKNVIAGNFSSSGTGCQGVHVDANWGTAPTVYIFNNVIQDCINGSDSTACGIGVPSASANQHIYNNTFKNCYSGIINSNSGTVAINNLFSGCQDSANATGTFSAGTDYNLTDSATAIGYTVTGGGNSHDQVNHAVSFVSASDFHLASALGHGVSDPGSGLFSDDIDGVTRSGTWDNGADQYVAAGGGDVSLALIGVSG